jgi:unsaturated rhamnogalacturonyl hydrolase
MNSDAVELVDRLTAGTLASGYEDHWDWGQGVAMHGVLASAVALSRPAYQKRIQSWLQRHRDFEPTALRHIMPGFAAGLAYQHWRDENGLALSRRMGDFLAHAPRTKHGCFRDSVYRPVWVDYWYELAPFLCVLAEITGDISWHDLAAEQSIAYAHACWDPATGLFWHMFYDSASVNSSFRWARANGWCVLAIAEMLTRLPGYAGVKMYLHHLLEQQAAQLERLQDANGLWHTVLDDPTTYVEVSASIMIALGLRRGVRIGALPQSCLTSADRAWHACLPYVDMAGRVTGVSGETPPGDSEHYNAIPTGVYPWGQGFFLLAAVDRLQYPSTA